MVELLLFFKIRDPIESNENWETYLRIRYKYRDLWNDLTFFNYFFNLKFVTYQADVVPRDNVI